MVHNDVQFSTCKHFLIETQWLTWCTTMNSPRTEIPQSASNFRFALLLGCFWEFFLIFKSALPESGENKKIWLKSPMRAQSGDHFPPNLLRSWINVFANARFVHFGSSCQFLLILFLLFLLYFFLTLLLNCLLPFSFQHFINLFVGVHKHLSIQNGDILLTWQYTLSNYSS